MYDFIIYSATVAEDGGTYWVKQPTQEIKIEK